MFDGTPEVDVQTFQLMVAGTAWRYDDLLAFSDSVTAVLDCTGGWYSEQAGGGVWLHRVLPPGAPAPSLNVGSITGHSRPFDVDEAQQLLLATRLDGNRLGTRH